MSGLRHPFDIPQSPQLLDPRFDPRASIQAADISEYLDHLTGISIKSKNDGNLIWGRVQGTKYEREASDYVEEQLKAFGFADVRKDLVPAWRPLWHLEHLELTVTAASGFEDGQTYNFSNALTAYQSATTPQGGVEAEVIFVGEGTAAELNGRDLTDKIVLLRTRGLPGGLFHSARTAYSRIAIGEYGLPVGVVVWSDVPNASVVATRVGAIGGVKTLDWPCPGRLSTIRTDTTSANCWTAQLQSNQFVCALMFKAKNRVQTNDIPTTSMGCYPDKAANTFYTSPTLMVFCMRSTATAAVWQCRWQWPSTMLHSRLTRDGTA